MSQPTINVKTAANAVLNSLPENVSWDELQYRLYVRQQIEHGLSDSDANRLIDSNQMRQRLEERKRNS